MCDGHDGDGILYTPSVGSNAPRDIAAVWKKIISTMSTIILWLIIHKSRSFVHQKTCLGVYWESNGRLYRRIQTSSTYYSVEFDCKRWKENY